ncbi:hypothetical protein K2X89_14765 [Myxococcota bacterium]|nr:hypothetical protein [Myxococcota bacterium]
MSGHAVVSNRKRELSGALRDSGMTTTGTAKRAAHDLDQRVERRKG